MKANILKPLVERYNKMPERIKASLWFFFSAFLQKGISFITTPIFTRLLNTSEYGQYGVFNSWFYILAIIVTLNLTCGVYAQGLIKFEDERDSFSSSLQGLNLILVLFWTIIYLLFNKFWNNLFSLTTVQMLAMLVMMWTGTVFSFWSEEQRVKLNYKSLVFISIVVSLLKPLVGILFVSKANDKVTARILGLVLVELICYSSFFFIQMKKGKVFFSKKFWIYALRFNIPLVPHYLSQSVLNGADRIMIERMIGASEAGMYNLAYSLSMIITVFNSALLATLSPWLFQKIKNREEKDIPKIAYAGLIFIAVLILFFIGLVPEVMHIFAPEEYHDAIYVIPPITMSVFFFFAFDLFARFELYYEKTTYIATATVCSSVLNVILNYIFIRKFGYYAAGYTTLVCYMLYALFHYFVMNKVTRDNMDGEKIYDSRILISITIIFLIIGFVFLSVYDYPIARYLIIILILIISFFNRKKLTKLLRVVREYK